jgi:hypothetical protein
MQFPSLAIVIASALSLGLAERAVAQDTPVTVVADQVRSQGFACSNPSTAERIEAESRPEEPVYLLTCEEAIYKVRLVPDQAAEVTKAN